MTVTATARGVAVATGTAQPNVPFAVEIPAPRLWSPERPFLYNLSVSYGEDRVESYFGMRELTVCADPAGVVRPCVRALWLSLRPAILSSRRSKPQGPSRQSEFRKEPLHLRERCGPGGAGGMVLRMVTPPGPSANCFHE